MEARQAGFLFKNSSPAKKSWESDFAATVENTSKRPPQMPIPGANPYTEHTKKHLIPA
jgi:hypothetical protein